VDAIQSSSAAFSKIPAMPRLRRIKEPLRSAQYAHLIATPTQPPRYSVVPETGPKPEGPKREDAHDKHDLRRPYYPVWNQPAQ
jgi:hypothetical protein